jgi:excisionase family DNA binding protein
MSAKLTPLFIRLPRAQAATLDRLASQSGRAKQHLVSELVAHALTLPKPGPLSMGRVEVSTTPETRDDTVLTLDEAASLLKLSPDAVQARAQAGDLPGRRFGNDWRFSRLALLAWLADGEKPNGRRGR